MNKKISKNGKVSIRSLLITLGIFAVLVYLGITIYKLVVGTPLKEEEIETNILPPTNTVQDFYTWYMSYKGNPIDTGAYKFNSNLATVFINTIDNRLYKNQLSYDPFVCSTDKPLGVSVIGEKITDRNATVEINEDFGTDKKINVQLVLEGTKWMISSIDCPQIEEQIQEEENKAKTKVTLFFNSNEREETDECGLVFDIDRIINNTTDPLTTAIQELLKGPNKAEEILGYTSVFSTQTEGMLKELKILDKTAYIDLKDYGEKLNKDFTPCESKSFKNSIENTIKHYREVDNIVFMLEGSKEEFDKWVK